MSAVRWLILSGFIATIVVSAPVAYGRSKTDVLKLVNGDILTGEIKKLDRGKMHLSTDAMGTVQIEWADIVDLVSQYYFEIEDHDGYKYYGTPKLEDEVFRVFLPASVATFEKDQIVRITPIEGDFWHRLKGSVSLGASFTKGTQIGRLDFSGDLRYQAEQNFFQLKLTTTFTSQEKQEATRRVDASFTYQRLFQRKVFWDVNTSAFRNDEQGVALRTTLATGPGVKLVQTNSHLFVAAVGVSVNREWATQDSVEAVNNLEGAVSADYSIFKYNTPKTDLSTSLAMFPRLPDFDRFRLNFEIKLRHEIIKDFFWDLTFWDDFDSKPPSEGALKNDLGIVTSFGYSF